MCHLTEFGEGWRWPLQDVGEARLGAIGYLDPKWMELDRMFGERQVKRTTCMWLFLCYFADCPKLDPPSIPCAKRVSCCEGPVAPQTTAISWSLCHSQSDPLPEASNMTSEVLCRVVRAVPKRSGDQTECDTTCCEGSRLSARACGNLQPFQSFCSMSRHGVHCLMQ